LRFLVRLQPADDLEGFLALTRSLAREVGAEVRNPKWTSYGALEVDVFVASRADFDLLLSAVEPVSSLEFFHDLNVAPPHHPLLEVVHEAREYFNAERYWESHEALEAVWRDVSGEEKRYVQGLILVCAAFVHHQKREHDVALSVLGRASKQLDYAGRTYQGIDTRLLRKNVNAVLETGSFRNFRI